MSDKGDTVLDFFLGSGSTAAVSHKLGRHYIGIEQMDYGKVDAVNRLLDVIKGDNKGISQDVNWKGGGSFIYAELAKLNQFYIDKIQLADEKQLGEIFSEMEKKAFIVYNLDLVKFKENIEIFHTLSFLEKREVLLSLLDLNQLYVNFSEIDDNEYKLSDEIKKLNKTFYNLK